MASDLVTENPITRDSSTAPFFAFREAFLHNPADFLKLGVVAASTTCFDDTEHLIRFKRAEAIQNANPESKALEKIFGPYAAEYGRYGNPTVNRAEELVGLLSGRDGSVIFPTKQNAIAALLTAELLRKPGYHHIILGSNPSDEVLDLLKSQLQKVSYTVLTKNGYANVGDLIQPNTRLVLLEGEGASIQRLGELDAVVRKCRERSVLSVLEGDAAIPRGPSSYEVAADVLIPTAIALSDRYEVSPGIVASNIKVVGLLKAERGLLGGIPAPEVAADLVKGLETFHLRAAPGGRFSSLPPDAESQVEILHRHNTIRRCERKLAGIDHAEDAVLFPSGMTATTVLFSALTLHEPGPKHIIVSAQGYRKNREYYTNHLTNAGVEITALEPEEFVNIRNYLKPHTKVVFIETPTNPFFRITDIRAAADAIGKGPNAPVLVVDHTFSTPVNQIPIDCGADLICASATKGLAGHNDTIAGVVAGKPDLIAKIRDEQRILGAYPAFNTADRLIVGLKSLEERIGAQNQRGLEVAQALEKDPLVKWVWYPGLPSHPENEVARRTLKENGYGGVISFDLNLSLEDTGRFIDALKLAKIAPSFGGNEPIVSQVAIISHYSQTPEERVKLGITPGLVRYSTGTLFTAEELIQDIRQALDVVRPKLSEGVILQKLVDSLPVPSGQIIRPVSDQDVVVVTE